MSLRKAVGLLTGFALAIGLIGAGVSASFTDSVTAQENINVGTFSCGITATSAGGQLGAPGANGYAHSVTYTAPTIMSSDASSLPFSFTVLNVGSIPDVLTVATSPVLSTPWSIIGAPFAAVPLASGWSHVYNTGVSWTELGNPELDGHFTVTWTVSCNEVSPLGVAYYAVNNGGTQFAPGTWVRSTSPIASTAVLGGGTATQSISGGGVNLAITAGGPYADNGFYVPLGTLSSLASSGYTAIGTGSQFGTNLYLDVNKDGEFFGWTSNSLSSIVPDAFGLGPTSAGGTLTVTGSTAFSYVCAGSPKTLTQLVGGDCAGIDGTTPVAVWVGITSSGAALSTTITSAP